jgi:hypothetical protein
MLSSDTHIVKLEDSSWDGIYISNSGSGGWDDSTTNSLIACPIVNIQHLIIDKSVAKITSPIIKGIRTFQVLNKSNVGMIGTDYHNNEYGIVALESDMFLRDVQIHNNGGDGIRARYAPKEIVLRGVSIHSNTGSGIDTRCSFATLYDVHIYENDMYGINSLSRHPITISNNSMIYNNGMAEVVGMGRAFPIFMGYKTFGPLDPMPVYPYNTVYDNTPNPTGINTFLLMALGDIESSIPISYLQIDTSDEDRFFPALDFFDIEPINTEPPFILLIAAITKIMDREFEMAFDSLVVLIEEYPDTDEAANGLMLLPMVMEAMGGDTDDIEDYIATIKQETLRPFRPYIHAQIKIVKSDYANAISLYEIVINDPPTDLDGLLAELDQAYVHFMAIMSGVKNLPAKATHKPMSFSELKKIEQDIYARISQLSAPGEDDGESVPEIPNFSLSNYPNPFNPETTIVFSIPSNTSTSVKLDIYNIKGQKVKSLIDDIYQTGVYRVVWDSRDEYGRDVASGIYFYRLQTDEYTTTRKMLLLK